MSELVRMCGCRNVDGVLTKCYMHAEPLVLGEPDQIHWAKSYAQGVADERARVEGIVKKMIQEEDEDDDGAEWFPWNSLDEILRRIRDKERPT